MTLQRIDDVERTTPEALAELSARLDRIHRHLLTPPLRCSLSEWCDRFRYLGYTSAEPGLWRTSRTPYLKEILDVAGDHKTRRMVLMAGAQVGKTSVLENVIAFYMAHDPCPIMLAYPNDGMAKTFSTGKLEPMLQESPALRKLVASTSKRDGGNTKLEKVFPGGFITLVSALSPNSLRARSIRVLLLDEIDGYPPSVGDEGDPIRLAEARTSTYRNSKTILASTPTLKGVSRIEREFLRSDQRYFYVPCPLCGAYQTLTFGSRDTPFGIKWDNHDPATAQYQCESCHDRFPESHKLQLMSHGQWRHTATSTTPGFHISPLYSPWLSWSEIVQKWYDAVPYPDKHQSFFNLQLGEPYEDKSQKIELADIASHCHPYDATVPSGVAVLTCGVDVQHEMLELAVYGFGVGEETWLIEEAQLMGDTSQQQVWDDLRLYLAKTFPSKNGSAVPITRTFVDANDQTSIVYKQVLMMRRQGIRVDASQGRGGSRAIVSAGKQYPNQPVVMFVGTHDIKFIFNQRLKNVTTTGAGYLHYPAHTDSRVLEQLLSERRFIEYDKHGQQTFSWKRIGTARNEQLDCYVYAYAAFRLLDKVLTDSLPALAAKLSDPIEDTPPETTTTAPSPGRFGGQATRFR